MRISPRGLSLLKQFEGCILVPYKDSAGLYTIGYGHLIADGRTLPDSAKYKISQKQADLLLKYDVIPREKAVERLCTVPLSQNEFDALVSFVFNLGAGCFQRSTIRQKLNRGDRAGAAKVLLRYNRAGGKVIKGLVNRRMAEFKLFMSNQYAFI